jgi:DNA mismatch repair protein MutS2
MAADTLKLLQFDELLSLLGEYISSPLGKAMLSRVAPTADPEIITTRQQHSAEAREYLRSSVAGQGTGNREQGSAAARTLPLRFSEFTDPAHLVEKSAIEGVVLELAEISELLAFAERAADVKRALLAFERRFPRLAEEASRIGDFHSLLRDLGGKILPTGELDDHASIELKRIRREMERQREHILTSLKSFLRAQGEDESPQEEIITIRGERFVVPVRAARKSRVQGVVHGASSTGQTVYVEPIETIELNNDLVRLREAEHREIQRILAEMTRRLREKAGELAESARRIAVIELAFGCGRFAMEFDCIFPAVASSHAAPASGPADQRARLMLKDARHPLLESLLRKKKLAVVPLSLSLEGDDRVLVISGPNTGGKTVALKTVGLLALMAMSGLPVPAAEAEFPHFDRILADIGDYQSIQESLSTFSAHLMNISFMLEQVAMLEPTAHHGAACAQRAPGRWLILLDELGSATDPEEAGALGVAVVDRFRASGAFTLVSTHHMLVKAYATNTPGVLSAHMGFDESTLEPSYRLEIGSPGMSSGLKIAQHLGFSPDVLAHARAALSGAHQEVESFLARLKEETAAVVVLRHELEEKLAAFDVKEKQWREDQRKREQERAREWEKQLDTLLRGFEERAEQKLQEIASRSPAPSRRTADTKKEAARIGSRLRDEAQDELRQAVVSHLGEAGEDVAVQPAVQREAELGDRVRLKDFRQFGIVRRKHGDSLEVEIGRLRTKASLADVLEVLPAATPTGASASVSSVSRPAREQDRGEAMASSSYNLRMERPSGGALSEINVIGENADDARSRVDKFLDNAFLAQLQRVRVVHGMGKGILQRALAEMFTTHPHVEKFFAAPQNEGGAGATIVELKV